MKMKNLFGLAAIAAVALSACSNDEVVENFSQDNAIQFSTYMGRNVQSRAAELTTPGLQEKGFGVFAFYTGQDSWSTKGASTTPNFMFNQEVTFSNNAWSYTPVKYWPTTQNDKISFFAYAPYYESTTAETPTEAADGEATSNLTKMEFSGNNTKGIPTITFTIADNPKDMVDFVADVQYDESRTNTTTADDETESPVDDNNNVNEVKFTLRHELTRVAMKAKVDEEVYGNELANKTIVNITGVKFDDATDGAFYKSAKYTFATTNENDRGTWSEHVAATTELDLETILDKKVSTAITDYKTEGVELKGTTAVSLFKKEGDGEAAKEQYLYLIPAKGENGLDESNKVTVTINYDIVTADTNLATKYSITSAEKTVELPKGILKQGTAYCLVFEIAVDKIELSAEVVDWDTLKENEQDKENEVDVDYTHDK